MEQTTELIKSVSIENLLQTRAAILERFEKMQGLAKEIKELGATLGDRHPPRFEWEFDGHRHSTIGYYREDEQPKITENYRKAIDRLAWAMLMEKSGFLTYMDAKAKEEWRNGLKENTMPELTYANIMATFQGLHANKGEMFDRGVINAFKSLSWDYKTNSPFKLTRRIIVNWCNGYSAAGKQRLDDLTRCLYLLDGKPEPEYRHSIAAIKPDLDFFENDYLTVKFYGNGNGHVTFLRLDLVKQLNEIIARHFPFHIPHDNKKAA